MTAPQTTGPRRTMVAGMLLIIAIAWTSRPATGATARDPNALPGAFVCFGNDPSWKLEIRESAAMYSSQTPGTSPEPVELRGTFRSLPYLTEPVIVWRGRGSDTPRDVVAMLIEARCLDTVSSREGQTEFPYQARISLATGELLAGCCRPETAAPDAPLDIATAHLPVADLDSKPPDDWSRLLMDLLPAIKACLARTPGTHTRVTKAWPMNKAMTGVRTRNDDGGRWECIAQVEGETVHLFEPLAADAEPLAGDGRVIFTPAAQPPPTGKCYEHERVLYPGGQLLGWLSYDRC